ncbi:MAG: hypothetical protein NWE93_02600 [Candidatus Bathyarchaeota archaeon]|nr:hypothetical protein [Candidatus Bathyarchaeota archaeon]
MPITLRITWKTQDDSQVCPKCKALEGYTWIVNPGDPYPKQLIHPLYGPVYDTRPAAEGSLVHEEDGHVCRCMLLHQYDVSDVFAKLIGNRDLEEIAAQETNE